MSEENKNNIEDQLKKIKAEMEELRNELNQIKASRIAEDIDDQDEPNRFTFSFDNDWCDAFDDLDDLHINLAGKGSNLGQCLSSTMKNVSSHIRKTIENATQGFSEHEKGNKSFFIRNDDFDFSSIGDTIKESLNNIFTDFDD